MTIDNALNRQQSVTERPSIKQLQGEQYYTRMMNLVGEIPARNEDGTPANEAAKMYQGYVLSNRINAHTGEEVTGAANSPERYEALANVLAEEFVNRCREAGVLSRTREFEEGTGAKNYKEMATAYEQEIINRFGLKEEIIDGVKVPVERQIRDLVSYAEWANFFMIVNNSRGMRGARKRPYGFDNPALYPGVRPGAKFIIIEGTSVPASSIPVKDIPRVRAVHEARLFLLRAEALGEKIPKFDSQTGEPITDSVVQAVMTQEEIVKKIGTGIETHGGKLAKPADQVRIYMAAREALMKENLV